jgi:hypothetical protein
MKHALWLVVIICATALKMASGCGDNDSTADDDADQDHCPYECMDGWSCAVQEGIVHTGYHCAGNDPDDTDPLVCCEPGNPTWDCDGEYVDMPEEHFCATEEFCEEWQGVVETSESLSCDDPNHVCCMDTAGGEPCPGYTGTDACCGVSDGCGLAGNGSCDCDGACAWDELDCELDTDTGTDTATDTET